MFSTRLRGIEMLEPKLLLTTAMDAMSIGPDRIIDIDILKPNNDPIIDIDIHHPDPSGIIDIDILHPELDSIIDVDILRPIGTGIIDIDILAPAPVEIIDVDILHPDPTSIIDVDIFRSTDVDVDIFHPKSGGVVDTGILRHNLSIPLSPETIIIAVYFDESSAPKSNAAYIVVQPMTGPTEAIVDLLSEVRELGLGKGTENSLVKKLEGAVKKLEDGNPKNDAAAMGKLYGFAHHVKAQAGKKIAEDDAEQLLSYVTEIIQHLA